MRAWPFLLFLAIGCDRKNPHGDMAPAETWDDPAAPGADTGSGLAPPVQTDEAMSGLPPGHPPIGPDDDLGDLGAADGDSPHGGMGDMGMAPDPDRPIDPSKFLRGSIKLGNAALPSTGVLFLAVRTPGPDGKPLDKSVPLAVDIVEGIPSFPLAFDLHEGKAMINGTTFVGDVLVIARIDQDGDADTHQAGDLYGVARATIPQEGLTVTLEPTGP